MIVNGVLCQIADDPPAPATDKAPRPVIHLWLDGVTRDASAGAPGERKAGYSYVGGPDTPPEREAREDQQTLPLKPPVC